VDLADELPPRSAATVERWLAPIATPALRIARALAANTWLDGIPCAATCAAIGVLLYERRNPPTFPSH
jgi:hypothetical protein